MASLQAIWPPHLPSLRPQAHHSCFLRQNCQTSHENPRPRICQQTTLLGQQKLSYNGLDVAFAPYSDYWREAKKLCALHLFSTRRVRSFRPIREDEVLITIRRLSQSAASHRVINLSETIMSISATLISKIAFGKGYELEDNKKGSERSRFQGLLNETQGLWTELCFVDYIPWLGWIDRIRGLHSRLDKTFKQLDMFYQQVIDDHMNPTTPQTEQNDVIDIFLQIMNAHSTSFDLTMDHIKALLMVMLGLFDSVS